MYLATYVKVSYNPKHTISCPNKISCIFTPCICELEAFYLVTNPKWSKTNPKLTGSGIGLIRLKARFGFGSG
jgi:hypothetical protein